MAPPPNLVLARGRTPDRVAPERAGLPTHHGFPARRSRGARIPGRTHVLVVPRPLLVGARRSRSRRGPSLGARPRTAPHPAHPAGQGRHRSGNGSRLGHHRRPRVRHRAGLHTGRSPERDDSRRRQDLRLAARRRAVRGLRHHGRPRVRPCDPPRARRRQHGPEPATALRDVQPLQGRPPHLRLHSPEAPGQTQRPAVSEGGSETTGRWWPHRDRGGSRGTSRR